ncbi:MAG: RDD family protein [Caulobacteraceae bacterium]|nr:RDD family protein [Caulobacteraceae bacterium]
MSDADARFERPLVTPEGVDLRVRLGEAGQRAAAFLIDFTIIVAVLIGLTILCLGAAWVSKLEATEWIAVVWLLGAFLLRNAYFIGFEMGPKAATPGKRIIGLRVAARNGGRLTAEAILTRNAMRELEIWIPLSVLFSPGGGDRVEGWMFLLGFTWCAVFVLLPLFNRDRLRAGDLAAGTWVVRSPRRKLLRDLAAEGRSARFAFTERQVQAYGVKELQVLEEVLRVADRRTMQAVAARIRRKIDWAAGPDESDGDFLAAYYAALRERLEQRLLFGHRRRDKHDVA